MLKKWREDKDIIQQDREEMFNFAKNLRNKYPNYHDYKIYHLVDFGGINVSDTPIVNDFPGEDSVVHFLEKLINSNHSHKQNDKDLKKAA